MARSRRSNKSRGGNKANRGVKSFRGGASAHGQVYKPSAQRRGPEADPALSFTAEALSARRRKSGSKTTEALSLNPPTNLQATGFADPRVDLTWTDGVNATGTTQFIVYRDDERIATVAAPTTTYTDTDVVDGSFRYQVALETTEGISPLSLPNSAAIPPLTLPGAPTNLQAGVDWVDGEHTRLTWNAATA